MKSNISNRCTTNYLPHDSQLFEFHLEQYHIIYKLRRRQEFGYCLFGVEYMGSSEKMYASFAHHFLTLLLRKMFSQRKKIICYSLLVIENLDSPP